MKPKIILAQMKVNNNQYNKKAHHHNHETFFTYCIDEKAREL